MFEVMGFREGVLVLPNGRPLPIGIDYVEMRHDCVPDIRISVIPGSAGRYMIDDFERRLRRRYERVLPSFAPFLPNKTPSIKKVIFNDPATIVIWSDDTKTVVKCQEGDTYSKELGLAMCISKKYLGNKGNFNEEFKKWIPEEKLEISEETLKLLSSPDFIKSIEYSLYQIGKQLVEKYKPEEETPNEDIQSLTLSIDDMRALLEDRCRYCYECTGCPFESDDIDCDFENVTDGEIKTLFQMLFKKKED